MPELAEDAANLVLSSQASDETLQAVERWKGVGARWIWDPEVDGVVGLVREPRSVTGVRKVLMVVWTSDYAGGYVDFEEAATFWEVDRA